MLTTALATAADDPARTAGEVIGRLLFLGIFAVMLIIGLRRRRATAGARGTALAVTGGVLLTLAFLGMIANLATTTS